MSDGVTRIAIDGDVMRFDQLFAVGGGGNSGFQALNLLAQLRVRETAIIGLDMGGGGITHWHGPGWPFGHGRLAEPTVKRWREATDAAAGALSRSGMTVINASRISALEAYPKQDILEVIEAWTQSWKADAMSCHA